MVATKPPILLSTAARLEELFVLFEQSANEIAAAWDELCRLTLQTGETADQHAVRDDYEAQLAGQLKMLDGLLHAARSRKDRQSVELTTRIQAVRDRVAAQYDMLFPKWQTVEDLEDILLAPLTPSNEQLKAYAAKHPPPQSWYDEEWEEVP